MRLDQAMVTRGLCESREKAQRLILAGVVRLNGRRAEKASDKVKPEDNLEVIERERYVSRGGYKLEHALREFGISVSGCAAVDVGASTGGFTDCLLQHGAASVAAIDVGHGQLDYKLRQDPRVTVMEKTNIRYVQPSSFPLPFRAFDLAVIDCSFISLRKVLEPVIALLAPGGKIIALVKPQFEAGKAEADKGAGVIRDEDVHRRVLADLKKFVTQLVGMHWLRETTSPLLGPAGNKEFLILLEKSRSN